MKRICLLAIALVAVASATAWSQTAVIAHRSHSGDMGAFAFAGRDNFGIDPDMERYMRLRALPPDSVVRTSDTSAIEFRKSLLDTMYHHRFWNNPTISLDSLRTMFPTVKFIGFEGEEPQTGLPPGASVRETEVAEARAPAEGSATATLLLIGALAVPMLACGIRTIERSTGA